MLQDLEAARESELNATRSQLCKKKEKVATLTQQVRDLENQLSQAELQKR